MEPLRGFIGRVRAFGVRWILVIPLAGAMVPPIYARSNPRLLGAPFVVWYQFVLVVTGLVFTAVVFVTTSTTESSSKRQGEVESTLENP